MPCASSRRAPAASIYRALDWLHEAQPAIERRLARQHLLGSTLVLYGLTPTWLTGRLCELAAPDRSRDGKRDDPQIVFGLVCTAEGCPISVDVFKGNTADPATVATQVAKLKERFGIQRIAWAGDRGMLTSPRIEQVLKPQDKLDANAAVAACKSLANVERAFRSMKTVDLNVHFNQRQLAARWAISEATLQRWRSEGIGPKFLKLCGRVLDRTARVRLARAWNASVDIRYTGGRRSRSVGLLDQQRLSSWSGAPRRNEGLQVGCRGMLYFFCLR